MNALGGNDSNGEGTLGGCGVARGGDGAADRAGAGLRTARCTGVRGAAAGKLSASRGKSPSTPSVSPRSRSVRLAMKLGSSASALLVRDSSTVTVIPGILTPGEGEKANVALKQHTTVLNWGIKTQLIGKYGRSETTLGHK